MIDGNEHTSAEFDQLLSMALLERSELFNETNNETMAQHALALQAEYAAVNNTAVLQKLQKEFGKKSSYKWWWNILIVALIGSGMTAILLSGMHSTAVAGKEVALNNQPAQPEQQIMLTAADAPEEKKVRRDEEIVLPVATDSLITEDVPEQIETPAYFAQGIPTRLYIPAEYVEDDADVPGLTESQIKANTKRKLGMFRDIAKKKSFVNVPAGPSWREGKRYMVNGFLMQASEVSNWQYNVFLNDLIADGRTEDYLAAKPVKGNWKAVNIPEFEETYATAEGFEKFPVLNISRAGAELYCKWLTTEMNEAITNGDIKWSGTKPDFRLPSDIEWMRAARGDDSTRQFPWGSVVNALQNARGCYLCNFNYSISKDALSSEGPEGNKGCISTKPNTRAVITTAGRAIDTLVTAPEYSYNPGVFGHYLLMGNAAEMVWTYDETQPAVHGAARAMGGSWYSHADNVRIESKEQFVGITEGNVQIGFRVIIPDQSRVVKPGDH